MVPHLLPVMMYQPQPTSTSLCHPFAPLQKRSEVEIDIILSPKQAQTFRDRINADGSDARAIDAALAQVKSENAEASVEADLEAIRTLIRKYSGGFGTLNDTVKQYLRRWFVSQGGVKVVARGRAGRPSQSSSGNSTSRVGPRTGSEKRVRQKSQTIAETSFAATGVSADQGYVEVGGSAPAAATSAGGKLTIAKRDGEAWGIGVKTDPVRGVVVTKIKPGGAGARCQLEVGSTFTKIDGVDALEITKAELLHTMENKTTITVELGPVIGAARGVAAHYYPASN